MDDDEFGAAPAVGQLHDLDTIARRLNVSTKTVRRMIVRGELGYHQSGSPSSASATPSTWNIFHAYKTGPAAK